MAPKSQCTTKIEHSSVSTPSGSSIKVDGLTFSGAVKAQFMEMHPVRLKSII